MGLASLILGLVGVSLAWLPGIGLIGLPLGMVAVVAGVIMLTNRHAQAGHWQYGLVGSILAVVTWSLSGAFQIKYGEDLLVPLADQSVTVGVIFMAISVALMVAGILVGRFKFRAAGIGLALLAAVALGLGGTWTLTIADREYTRNHPLELQQQSHEASRAASGNLD